MPEQRAPNFHRLVRERLGILKLDSAQQEEIVAELAGHLEETHEQLCAKGLCKADALQRSLEEIDWRQLSRKIQSAKHEGVFMNNRTKQFWLPALVSLALSEGMLLALSFNIASHPRLLMMGAKLIYLPWLGSLPFVGAAAAYLARRAGGERRTLLAASLFPAAMALCYISAGIAFTLVTGVRIFARPQWFYASMAMGVGVIVPAALLLLGEKVESRATSAGYPYGCG